jgi:hypothetical protein
VPSTEMTSERSGAHTHLSDVCLHLKKNNDDNSGIFLHAEIITPLLILLLTLYHPRVIHE